MRNMLLTSALSGSLALTPQALLAQDYDSWTLGREVLNAAANYTGVLTTAHAQVRKYITWQWGTTLPEADQRKRTADLLAEITTRQQVTAELVPSLDMDVLAGFGIRFRYCDGMLLSYFTSTGFKHGLSAQQIVDAPELRARRADTAFTGEPLGIVKTVGGVLSLITGDRSQIIPACMGTKFGGALDVDTVAYMTSAVRKFGIRRSAPGDRTEIRDGVCRAEYPRYPLGEMKEAREIDRRWRFDDSPDLQGFPKLLAAVIEIEGEWAVSDDRCYRNANDRTSKTRVSSCPSGYTGNIRYQRQKTVTGVDWHSDGWLDELSTAYTAWVVTVRSCRYVPPPPPVPWTLVPFAPETRVPKTGYESCSRGDCIWVDTSGGVGGWADISHDRDSLGGGGAGSGNGGGDKIVCTAMNARYGFGSYRQAIWLAHARRMSPYHQTGYHLIFLPLVRYGYRAEGKTRLAVRHALEHIARHRTADIRAEMQQRKRWLLGRSYRAVLEPLCYAVGWLADGRQVAGIADVAQIATPRKSAKPTPKHFKNNIGEVQ